VLRLGWEQNYSLGLKLNVLNQIAVTLKVAACNRRHLLASNQLGAE
jgi:hypothetical protein